MFDYEFDTLRDSVGSGEKKGEKQRGSLMGSQRTMDITSRRDTQESNSSRHIHSKYSKHSTRHIVGYLKCQYRFLSIEYASSFLKDTLVVLGEFQLLGVPPVSLPPTELLVRHLPTSQAMCS